MYKDVKKKLLSVAICVCMILGMVQVVPRAKAAEKTISGTNVGTEVQFKVKCDLETEKYYTGKPQLPDLDSVILVEGTETTNVTNSFKLRTVPEDHTNAGSYDVYLESTAQNYKISGDAKIGTYEIRQATFGRSEFSCANVVPIKNSSGAVPKLSTAKLVTYRGAEIDLSENQYTVEAVTQTGRDVEAKISVSEEMKNNFTDDAKTQFENMKVNCRVAYDLSENDWYEVAFLDENDQKMEPQADYTAGPTIIKLGVFEKGKDSLKAKLDTSGFSINPGRVTEIGDHTIAITPVSGEHSMSSVDIDGAAKFFTGVCNKKFTVKGKKPQDLKVYVKNPSAEGTIDLNHTALKPVWKYNNGNSVRPEITSVEDANGKKYIENVDFTVVPPEDGSDCQVGRATMILRFKNTSTYEGDLTLSYNISSDLKIGRIGFESYGWYEPDLANFELYYTGKALLPNAISVTAESGVPLKEGTHYTVSYSYQDSSGWHELTAVDAKDNPNMAKAGLKRVVITGMDIFQGQSASKQFTVAEVNVNDHLGWFKVSFVDGKDEYDYNGQPQIAKMLVMYSNDYVKDQDVTNEFDVSYANHVSAGKATATLTAKTNSGFKGSLTKSYTINHLSLSNAGCVDDEGNDSNEYRYTGAPIEPSLKIGDYALTKGTDYVITSYRDATTNTELQGPPTDPGSYEMLIEEGTNKNNVQGSKPITYQIVGRDIASSTDVSFQLKGDTYEWDGGDTEPEVICGGSLNLIKGKDYTVTYDNNSAPTTDAKVIIEGIAPYLLRKKELTFTITERSINNPNIAVTPSAVTGSAPNYNVSLNVWDSGNNVVKHQLAENTDYKVASIVYKTDNEFKGVTCSALNALPYAGEYEITLEGIGNYQGTRTVTVKCGTDITDGEVNVHPTEQLYYNAEEQFPDIYVRVDGIDYELASNSTSGDFIPYFTRGVNDTTPSRLAAVNAGTVYVQVQGNPEKGFYGTTKQKDHYEILPIDILKFYQVKFTDAMIEDGKAYYTFTNKTVTPQAIVVSTAAITGSLPGKLNPVYDYTIRYGENGDDPRIKKGSHTIYIEGTGNFTGTIPATFYIKGMSIDDPGITVEYENEDTTYAEETSPTIVLTLPSGQRLVRGTDYNVNPERVVSGDAFYYVYDVTGIGNFNETSRVESWKIPSTPLRAPDVISDPKSGDTIWNDTKLTVKKNGSQIAESEYKFSYIKKNGAQYDLKYDEDYTVEKYTGGTEPGEKTQLTIRGKTGRFVGPLTVTATLYTDIGDAQFSKDADTNENVGTLYPKATVSTKDLKDAIDNGTLSNLISFDKIWDSDAGAYIDPSCYTVSLSCGDTPKIGPVVVTVAGNNEKYYAGSQNFTITVTGSLEGNVDRVVVGTNNAVEWNKDQPVTPDTVEVEVWSTDNRELKEGEDYTVVFENNNGVGLAKAIITGIGKYSGTLTQPFKITYPMSQLTIEIQNKEGVWEEYKGGASYLYDIETVRNQRPIRLLYPAGASASAIVDSKCYSVSYSGYEKAGPAKAIIGEPEDEAYKGILLGTGGRVVDYTLEQIDMKNVTIDIENPNQMYTGLEKNDVLELGLKVSYNGSELKDADYTLLFRNATNTDDVDGKKATVTVTGKGNFTGSETKEFNISPLPLWNEEYINAIAQDITYTGKQETPRVTISQVKGYLRTLREGEDYRIVGYTDETKATRQDMPFEEIGTYFVVVEGLKNYASPVFHYIEYHITKREMADGLEMTFISSDNCPVINGEPQCTYNGKKHEPNVYVTFNGLKLRGPSEKDPQYDLNYEDNLNAGTATVTVKGIGSFNGEKTMTFMIAPKDLSLEDIEYRDGTGKEFADEQEFPWSNDGKPVHPEIIVYDKSLQAQLKQQLTDGEKTSDYSIKYEDDSDGTQTNAGEVLMTIVGQNNYIGSKQFTYFIGEDISKSYVLVNGQKSLSVTYNGLTQVPKESDISVVWNSDLPQEDENGEKRYKIAYYYYDQGSADRFDLTHRVSRDQIVNAGTYYIAVVGEPTKGTYAKSDAHNSCTYTVNPRSISPSYILVSGYDATYYYTGQPIQPRGIAVEDTDLPVTGEETNPQRRSVKLINGTDYDLSYVNNTAAGKASIIVTGKGNYTGNRVAYFNILSSNADGNNTWDGSSEGTGSISNGTTTIAASDIILGYDNSDSNCMMYNGYERIPTVTINGISTNEFIITASNNIRPGVATLTITGRGNNFTGTIIKNYKIKANLAVYGSISAIEDQVYSGYQITPHVTVTCGGNLLNPGNDYTLTYLNNTNVGRATVMATATNDSYYIGSASGSFNISNTAGGMEITGYASSYTYTGYAVAPDVVVTMNGRVLNRGTDYTVSYSNNTNVGTATMTVTGIGSFSGTKTINYTIEAKNIENCLTTAVDNYQYTGSTYTPNVSVTDSSTGKTLIAGTDYTITYSNNTNPGTASITITALSKNYTGSKVIPFKITSASVSGLRTSSIKNNSVKLAWSAQDYADGYQICNSSNRVIATTRNNSYTVKGLTSCTTYRFKVRSYVENADGSISYGGFSTAVSAKTLLNTPKLKAASTRRGTVTLTWSKVAKATGYEIYYSTKKNGVYTRLKTISKSSSRRYVDRGLASGERYYYTIRAYRTTNGVKTYSSYNTIKSVKVK